MPTRNTHLTAELDRLIQDRVEAGSYSNASEVVRAGLHALRQDEVEDQAKLEALREAITAGIASGVAAESAMDRLRQCPPKSARAPENVKLR